MSERVGKGLGCLRRGEDLRAGRDDGICEILDFEAVNLANEGTFILVVNPEDKTRVLEVLIWIQKSAAVIGIVSQQYREK